jgi:hypothetical protein
MSPQWMTMPCGGACVVIDMDPLNCGMCGNACSGGQYCQVGSCTCGDYEHFCNGVCTSHSDPLNCGSCGNVCSGGKVCKGDKCECGQGYQDCNGVCFDVQSDPAHCGLQCQSCPPNNACIQGVCHPQP